MWSSSFFHSASCFQSLSISQHELAIHSFLWLSITFYEYHVFLKSPIRTQISGFSWKTGDESVERPSPFHRKTTGRTLVVAYCSLNIPGTFLSQGLCTSLTALTFFLQCFSFSYAHGSFPYLPKVCSQDPSEASVKPLTYICNAYPIPQPLHSFISFMSLHLTYCMF